MQPIPDFSERLIKGDSEEDAMALKSMAQAARIYVESFDWACPIKDIHLTFGIGEVIAVFIVKFTSPLASGDTSIWVIIGDIPSAYMVADDIQTPQMAMEVYCDLMEDWANAVLDGSSLADIFPVRAEHCKENARSLLTRVGFLRKEVIPNATNLV